MHLTQRELHNKHLSTRQYNCDMELELDGASELEVSGNIEITLPSYMTMLPQVELDEVMATKLHQQELIIAAGRKASGEIVLFTASKQVFVLGVGKHNFPDGQVYPIDAGYGIAIFTNGGFHEVPSIWALRAAEAINIALLT